MSKTSLKRFLDEILPPEDDKGENKLLNLLTLMSQNKVAPPQKPEGTPELGETINPDEMAKSSLMSKYPFPGVK